MEHGMVLHDVTLMGHAIELARKFHHHGFDAMTKEEVALATLYEAYPWFSSYQLFALWLHVTEQPLRNDQEAFLQEYERAHASICLNAPAADGIAIFLRLKTEENMTPLERHVRDRLVRKPHRRRHPHLAFARALELCGQEKPPYFDHLRSAAMRGGKKFSLMREEAAEFARSQLYHVAIPA